MGHGRDGRFSGITSSTGPQGKRALLALGIYTFVIMCSFTGPFIYQIEMIVVLFVLKYSFDERLPVHTLTF